MISYSFNWIKCFNWSDFFSNLILLNKTYFQSKIFPNNTKNVTTKVKSPFIRYLLHAVNLYTYDLRVWDYLCLWDVKCCCNCWVFDSLRLTLLPQFNRQQRKKGRGRKLLSVSQPTQKDVSLLCHSKRQYLPTRLGKNQIRPQKSFVHWAGRWSWLRRSKR